MLLIPIFLVHSYLFKNWDVIDILVSDVKHIDSIFVYIAKWSPQQVNICHIFVT